jgi:hypothetical protein
MRLKNHFGALCVCVVALAAPNQASADDLQDLLSRSGKHVSGFLELFSDVKCIEQVRQEKLGENNKVEAKEESTYDYLVILTNPGGELTVDESRLAVHESKSNKKNSSLLVSNGFATLFLIFHPYYASSFQFTALEDELVNGRRMRKVGFQHIAGSRSPAALALRGREYPLELSGTALIDPESGAIAHIVAGVENSMQDVGVRTLRADVQYAPVPFRDVKDSFWFPLDAVVEVETPRQHWRNTHHFSDYKRFSVSTEEQVAQQ